MEFKHIGANFSAVKPLAILTVATSHFYGGLWWVPTAIALFLFGFSSGYFTGEKYSHKVDLPPFWRSKFFRLVPRLLVINSFLLLLFLWRGEPGIFTWHTIVNVLGLSGFLNWLFIANMSPYGMGLWFFTVLLLFYLIYPLIAALKTNPYLEKGLLIVAIILASWLQFRVRFGYQLWPTALSFLVGVYYAKRKVRIKPVVLFGAGWIVLVFVAVFNVGLSITNYNYYLILVLSILISLFFLVWPIPAAAVKTVSWLDTMVLEIYLIHPYLFVHPDSLSKTKAFLISIIIIIVVAFVLSQASKKLGIWFEKI